MNALLIPVVAMLIPIVSIVGGIAVAIFRNQAQQRVAEWAMKERIAAIEKGLDPARLPPLPAVGDPAESAVDVRSPREQALATSQGLFIAGTITCFAGVGLAVFFLLLDTGVRNLWAVGLLAGFVGAGLLVAGGLVRHGADALDPRPAAPFPPGR